MLELFLFRFGKLAKNNCFDKYKYSGYGVGFDAFYLGSLSLSDVVDLVKKVTILDADMSCPVHVDNREMHI